ncbi:MAG: hypothetical protein PHI98_12035 [Eubacteriales bacterium]|nr:hypothetical protein [Eubacteriales bacterium]
MRKVFKVMSIIVIIFAVITMILSAVSLAGGIMLGSASLTQPTLTEEEESIAALAFGMGALAIVMGVIALLQGLFNLLTGIMGVRGANGEPRCAGKAKVMGIISLVVAIVVNVYSLWGSVTFSSVCYALFAIALQLIFVYYASKLQREDASTLER